MKKKSRILGLTTLALACGLAFTGEVSAQTAASNTAVAQQQDSTSVTQLQQELLGQYADINSLTATNLRQAYITLLESARAKQGTWTDQDWKKAHAIINKLDARKNSLSKQLGADDKAKIKVLQGELRALETKGDVKD